MSGLQAQSEPSPALPVVVAVPPMTQLNTPYASLPLLSGLLRSWGHAVRPVDFSIELALDCFSSAGTAALLQAVAERGAPLGYEALVSGAEACAAWMDPVLAFLQGRDLSLATRLVQAEDFPVSVPPPLADLELPAAEAGRLLATRLLIELTTCWQQALAPDFALTSYGERVAGSATSFAALAAHLAAPPDPILRRLLALLPERIPADTRLLLLTCPFPGNLPAALHLGAWCKKFRPECFIVLGGGYPSTELRRLRDPGIFSCVDAIVLDDATAPLQALLRRLQGDAAAPLQRTFTAAAGAVQYHAGEAAATKFKDLPCPDYEGLDLGRYLDLADSTNPMHRLWNDGRWLKLTAAYGCYWKKCTFCDITLPYIGDFQPASVGRLADHMDQLSAQTGRFGFHFTDEAAPPALLVQLAAELLRRRRRYHWWGNIRFDDYFTHDRCRLLAAAGMIAVSGGLEVADDRLLALIDKGVSLAQAVRVTHAFASTGIMVHAYLMYGFPSQTRQETVDSAEVVRQLIAAGLIHSAYWHRFTATAHAPAGQRPEAFGIRITGPQFEGFAWNNLQHADLTGAAADDFDGPLAAALAEWLRGAHLAQPAHRRLRAHATAALPTVGIAPTLVEELLAAAEPSLGNAERGIWLGPAVVQHGAAVRLQQSDGQPLELQFASRADAAAVVAAIRAATPSAWRQAGPPRLRECGLQAVPPELAELGFVQV